MKFMYFALFVILVLFLGYFTVVPRLTPAPPVSHLDPYKIYDLINDYRASKGLKKLVFDPTMCSFASKRLSQMYTDYSHKGFKNVPYKYVTAGENIATGYNSDQELVADWIASPEHLSNIVESDYTSTCIRTDTRFAVQEFASF